ncbi:MAG: hypothetical protein ABSA83_07745 [Verrucomicrobiota bacterium]|jgi:hypothetical protein
MKPFNSLQVGRMAGSLAVALALISSATKARAYVYATDIQINGGLTIANADLNYAASITYRLNQAADRGVTVNILQGSTVVKSIPGGTNMGLNSVSWTPTNTGTYSVSVTAGATGFPVWTKISLDSSNNVAVDPEGIAVDNNTNSPYYGRVMVGCASSGTQNGVTQDCGIYKMNADGSPADEGSFGYGGYTTADSGDTATGEMYSANGYNPWRLRIGDDDRLYMEDWSSYGAVVAFDMKVTTNQIVINESGYLDNPFYDSFTYGLGNFDITFATTTNAAVWLCCDDPLDFGLWYWHMTNGAAVTTNTVGTWAVEASSTSDLSLPAYSAPLFGTGGGMVDTNLDIFISQFHEGASPNYATMLYNNWNGGSLWPVNPTGDEYGQSTGQVHWGAGANDTTFECVQDTVINNRQHPTMVALPMTAGSDDHPGIRVLNATNGSVIHATNGATVQTLTNLDYPNQYTCAAWDNVGNLYGASSSAFFWRVWSPPGTNLATTLATVQVEFPTAPDISKIQVIGTNVTINFSAGLSDPASAFTLISSPTVNGSYAPVNGATISGSGGSYQAQTTVNGSTLFYRLGR